MANHLKREKKLAVIAALVEGNSIRSVERLTGVHRDTVMRLALKVGEACEQMMIAKMRDLDLHELQADEIWTFVHKKQKQLTRKEFREGVLGDQYVFVAMDRKTKLVPTFRVGKRNGETALAFMLDLKRCLNGCRPQLSTDAFEGYADAVEWAFGPGIDYAQLIKIFEAEPTGRARYGPPKVSETIQKVIVGAPREDRVCTSHVERQNLTMRMSMRRFTRLTNAFSKKLRNLRAAVALYFAHYNFCRVHKTLRCTPAMEAKVADHVWGLDEILDLAA